MEDTRVKFIGMKGSRPLIRYVERQIAKWINQERTLLFRSSDTDFYVEIERDREQLGYECSVWIRIGARQWANREEGRTLHSTLETALRHLRPVIRPMSVTNESSPEVPAGQDGGRWRIVNP